MLVQPYLSFEGRAEEAIEFYKEAVGAKVTMIMRNKESPEQHPGMPPNSGDKIMHSAMTIGDSVVMAGRYASHELPRLMEQTDWVVVPSRWWENSPLVIQEAFGHGRPVICSDIGGMAEKVIHGVNGLHFHVGDSVSLAETIRTAVADEGLWGRLRDQISPPHGMEEHTHRLEEMYNDLLERRERGFAPGAMTEEPSPA